MSAVPCFDSYPQVELDDGCTTVDEVCYCIEFTVTGFMDKDEAYDFADRYRFRIGEFFENLCREDVEETKDE